MMTAWAARVNQKMRNGSTPFLVGGYFFSIIYALIIIIPLYFVVISAFKNNTEIINTPLAFPLTFNFSKFIQAQANVNLLHAIMISTGVTIGAELVTLLLAFPAAYAVARIQTRLSRSCGSHFCHWVFDPWACHFDANLPDDRQSRAALSSNCPGHHLPGFQPASIDDLIGRFHAQTSARIGRKRGDRWCQCPPDYLLYISSAQRAGNYYRTGLELHQYLE